MWYNFDRDDGAHRWESLRPQPEYFPPPGIAWIFAEAARKHREPPARGVTPNEENQKWQRLIRQFTGQKQENYWIVDPNKALQRKNDLDTEYLYTCPKCKSTNLIPVGAFIQCRPCGNKRQRKFRERHLEEVRARDRHRKRVQRAARAAEAKDSTPPAPPCTE